MKILVIGYGSMGQRHARNARDLGCEVVVADYDTMKERQIERDGYVLGNPRILSRDTMGVVIATPAKTHSAILRDVGHRPILMEKPLATSAACVDGLNLDRVTVGYQLRFHRGIRQLLHDAQQHLGPQQIATFRIHCDKASWPGADYADMLLEASHELDLAYFFYGDGHVAGAAGHGDQWVVLLQHERHRSVLILDGQAKHRTSRSIQISGQTGSATLDYDTGQYGGFWSYQLNSQRQLEIMEDVDPIESLYRAEMARWLGECDTARTIQHASIFPASGRSALAVLRWCDAARKMAHELVVA